MKHLFFGILVPVCLCTCGRAEDKPTAADAGEVVERQEKIFNGAYQELDAAVMDRLLAEDYTVDYRSREPSRSREQFLGELGQLRLIFPQLRIELDSTRSELRGDTVVVEGIRTFNWTSGEGPGSYREGFTNKWLMVDQQWQLLRTELNPGS